MAKFQTTHRVATASGIETEESLLSESAARETSLNSQIIELELENKQVFAGFKIFLIQSYYVKSNIWHFMN